MPELPEVETTRMGIQPHIQNKVISGIIIRQSKLRFMIPDEIHQITHANIQDVKRRGKYLIIETNSGHIIIHLGMSGSLHIVNSQTPPGKHDHVDILLDHQCLRYKDPRKFGCVLFTTNDPLTHPLLINIGPEPLTSSFDGRYLYETSKNHKTAIKKFIMDGHIVAGVGNIYANESLFLSGIHPKRAANNISKIRYEILANAVKSILNQAIKMGGTTLKDFLNHNGKPGYFQQYLNIYGKQNQACPKCQQAVKMIKISQRATYYCASCQH